jgi:hypothetical protein
MSFYSTYQCNLLYRCATHLGHLPDPSHPDHNKLPNFFSPFFYSCLGHIIYPLTLLHHDIMPSCVCISMCLFKKKSTSRLALKIVLLLFTKIVGWRFTRNVDGPFTLHRDRHWKLSRKNEEKYRIFGRESIMMNTNGYILEKSTVWKQPSILALMIWKLSYF